MGGSGGRGRNTRNRSSEQETAVIGEKDERDRARVRPCRSFTLSLLSSPPCSHFVSCLSARFLHPLSIGRTFCISLNVMNIHGGRSNAGKKGETRSGGIRGEEIGPRTFGFFRASRMSRITFRPIEFGFAILIISRFYLLRDAASTETWKRLFLVVC